MRRSICLIAAFLVTLLFCEVTNAGERKNKRHQQEAQAAWNDCEAGQCWKNASNKPAEAVPAAKPDPVIVPTPQAVATEVVQSTACQGGSCQGGTCSVNSYRRRGR